MTRPSCTALATAVVCVALSAAPARAERTVYAIAIGNNQPPPGETGLATLRYADDDAVRYFELFRRAGKNVALLTVLDAASQRRHGELGAAISSPTLHELRWTVQRFRAQIAADRARGDQPVLFFTYSGHGALDEQGRYFLSLLDGGLTQELLYEEVLAAVPDAEVHLIIDACNAEGVVGVRGPFDREAEAQVVSLSDAAARSVVQAHSLSRFPFVGALVASSTGQETHEWSELEAGVFTHEVVSALLGAADVNGDLRIEYSEVEAFVVAANRKVPDPRAVPQILARPPANNPRAVLVDLTELDGTVFLTGSAQQLGRISLAMPNGQRLLDAHLDGPARIALALPKRAGMFVQKGEDEADVPSGRSVVSFAELSFKPKRASARGSLDRTLREGLFGAQFSVEYYRGFVDSQGLSAVDFSSAARPLPAQLAGSPAPDGAVRDTGGGVEPWVPTALLITAGAALATAAVSFGLALDAKNDFEDTELQREAHDLNDRYGTLTSIGLAAAAVAVASGVGAFLTWPAGDDADGISAGVQLRGQF